LPKECYNIVNQENILPDIIHPAYMPRKDFTMGEANTREHYTQLTEETNSYFDDLLETCEITDFINDIYTEHMNDEKLFFHCKN